MRPLLSGTHVIQIEYKVFVPGNKDCYKTNATLLNGPGVKGFHRPIYNNFSVRNAIINYNILHI